MNLELDQSKVSWLASSRASISWAEVRFLVKASRPGFWLTAAWFYLLPLGPDAPLSSFSFWLGLVYIGFPLGMLIYAGNDVTDTRTDALNPRKDSYLFGARPTLAQIRGLPLRILLVQAPFVALFTFLLGPRALVWFAATVGASLIYNSRSGAKDRAGFYVLAQISYLLVFVLSSWLCQMPLSPWPLWVFGTLFAMHSHLFGQIMDIEPDARAGRQTTAVCMERAAPRVSSWCCCASSPYWPSLLQTSRGWRRFWPSAPFGSCLTTRFCGERGRMRLCKRHCSSWFGTYFSWRKPASVSPTLAG